MKEVPKQIPEMIEFFRTNYPEIKIQYQPESALNELLDYENRYHMNTLEALHLKEKIGEEIHFSDDYLYLEKWESAYRTYEIFKGDMSLINTWNQSPFKKQEEEDK